jgi:hypothetical protein
VQPRDLIVAQNVVWRIRAAALHVAWSRRQVGRKNVSADTPPPSDERPFRHVLPPDTVSRVPQQANAAILSSANQLLEGEWKILGVPRTDLVQPDWFRDPVTGHRSDPDRYAFRINRAEERVGNVKQLWELSRLQHLTLLATAWFLTDDDRYARRVAQHLRSWWRENPFLSGVHWTNGAELGIRLISLVWIRRLMDGWPGIGDLFENDGLAVRQIRWHQQYLATFRSRGSSVGHQVIAEMAGQFVACCAFPWFAETEQWRYRSAKVLERELIRNTFPSGVGRELPWDDQCFIAELGFLAAVEAEISGHPLGDVTWQRLSAMADSAAALVDEQLRAPRQGHSGQGRGLLLDAPSPNRMPGLLALADALVGRLDWWPRPSVDAGSVIVGTMNLAKHDVAERPTRRPSRFADAGITLLRTAPRDLPEIWCRCDGGTRGCLSTAGHVRASALSVEVRYGGVDILAEPGTCCYDGDPAWRSYFRSTIAHNTAEIGDRNQSIDGGPFTWSRQARVLETQVIDYGDVEIWAAEHDGYSTLDRPVRHCRSVMLDRASRSLDMVDQVDGHSHDIRLAFHFGPEVQADLEGACAVLRWPTAATPGAARLELPPRLSWSLHTGETDPILGWYVHSLGRLVPAATLIGCGRCQPGTPLTTRLEFIEAGISSRAVVSRQVVPLFTSGRRLRNAPQIRTEVEDR